MIEYTDYSLEFDDVFRLPYRDVVVAIYDAIPSHEIEGLTKIDLMGLLGYYPKLYTQISKHFSLLLEKYESRVDGKVKDLKNAYDQALKAIKFQYEALSRKISVDKDEDGMWSGYNKK